MAGKGSFQMIVTTTPSVEGHSIVAYAGIVTGSAIVGANIFRDFFARMRDIVGGRARGYESALRGAQQAALQDLIDQANGLLADAIVGLDFGYASVGNSMLMVNCSATAVTLDKRDR
jgi:uncharacterized protein YbjQ (UPF0145 family)